MKGMAIVIAVISILVVGGVVVLMAMPDNNEDKNSEQPGEDKTITSDPKIILYNYTTSSGHVYNSYNSDKTFKVAELTIVVKNEDYNQPYTPDPKEFIAVCSDGDEYSYSELSLRKTISNVDISKINLNIGSSKVFYIGFEILSFQNISSLKIESKHTEYMLQYDNSLVFTDYTPKKDDGKDKDKTIDFNPSKLDINSATGIIKANSVVKWKVVDRLIPHCERNVSIYEGKQISLEPGIYLIYIENQENLVMVNGTLKKTYEWDYYFKGTTYHLSLDYSLDYAELADNIKKNEQFNRDSSNTSFKNLPKLVVTNSTTDDIASKLIDKYEMIGGQSSDRQGLADFIVSFAQSIKFYQDVSKTDEKIWNNQEYWSNSIETLAFMMGDVDDSAPLADALLKSAGYKTAIVGASRMIFAAVTLDNFQDRDLDYYSINKSIKLTHGKLLDDDQDESEYYPIMTNYGQIPVGYIYKSSASILEGNEKSFVMQGKSGYYNVP